MTTPAKKPKFERSTQEQLNFYINFCRSHPEFLAGKNNPKNPQLLQNLWTELTEGLNALSGPERTAERWKDTMKNWKNQQRLRARKIIMEQRLTGGGPSRYKTLTDFEELALETFGMVAVDGLPEARTLGFSTVTAANQTTSILNAMSPIQEAETTLMSPIQVAEITILVAETTSMPPSPYASTSMSPSAYASTSMSSSAYTATSMSRSPNDRSSPGRSRPLKAEEMYSTLMESIRTRDLETKLYRERSEARETATLKALERAEARDVNRN